VKPEDQPVSADATQHIESLLAQNEVLLWSGRPRQEIAFRTSDLVLVPLSLLWGGLGMAWGAQQLFMALLLLRDDPGLALAVAGSGACFAGVGLMAIAGRFWVDAYRRTRTFYGLTDRRIIIASEALGRSVKSVPLGRLERVWITDWRKGRATLRLGGATPLGSRLRGKLIPRLEWIESAEAVSELIERTRLAAQLMA
jgi:hypothetical protein